MLRVIVSSSYCLTFKFLKSATYSSSLPQQAYLLEVLVTPALGVTGFALPVLFLIIVYFKILKLEKKEGYQTINGRIYKRNYWLAYLKK